MYWQDFLKFMSQFRTDLVLKQLTAWHVGELGQNPYILGGVALTIAITYFVGLKTISALIVGFGGFIYAISYTVSQGSGTEGLSGDGLWVLIGGGGGAIFLCIYLLFIKTE